MKRRDDLQGLRAVAVLVVALGHAGVGFLGGGYVGVDVFFVLSGFLITGLLLDEARRTGTVSLAGFYTRRARRILPAAALTLVATELAAYVLLNFVRARQVMWDSVWAAFFGANVHFSRIETDYFARDRPPSPIQHFWTLAVEEQFYLVWPALLGLVLFGALLLRRRRGAVTPASTRRLLAVLLLATAASLAWSMVETSRLPTAAYFSTFARAWELGLGAALAVVAGPVAALRAELRATAGWLGFGAIALASTTFSSRTAFPGYAALLPTLGAALVIAGGTGGQPAYGVGRLLSVAPMRWVGDRSYTLYLWHWPILILAMEYAGHRLSLVQNLALLAGAVAVSALTFRFYENPI
ncbi:MAG TPA: acyltransferase, partial [Gaiellaceae bacterium]